MIRADQSKQYLSELLQITKANLVACGFQKLTVDGTVGGVSLTVPSNARYALCVVESTITSGPAIRYLELGGVTPPTASNGIPRANYELFDLQGYQNMVNFRAIQFAAGTHSIQVQYYK